MPSEVEQRKLREIVQALSSAQRRKNFSVDALMYCTDVGILLALLREREEENRRLREAALIGQRWMKWWLEQKECDCEESRTCGRHERQRELERINAALRVEQIDAALRGEQP